MLYIGQSITNPSEILHPVTEEQVFLKISLRKPVGDANRSDIRKKSIPERDQSSPARPLRVNEEANCFT